MVSEGYEMTDKIVNVAESAAIAGLTEYESQARRLLRRIRRHKLGMAGGIIVAILILSALLAPLISPNDPVDLDTSMRFFAPLENANFLLGTDEMGRCTLSRLIYGGRISLVVGFAAMAATVFTGLLIGLMAGYYGGKVDNVLMRFTDTMLCFPQVFMLLVLAAFITPNVISIALIIGLTSWMEVARIIRSQILYIKEQDFIQAAVATGASNTRIMLNELLPNALAPIIVAATLRVAHAILAESYISFLGYGIQAPLSSWGNMLTNAQAYFDLAPWLAIIPGAMITIAVFSFNFLGDALRDALDPRLRM
jgi:peptide/nickel transport system permease protein